MKQAAGALHYFYMQEKKKNQSIYGIHTDSRHHPRRCFKVILTVQKKTLKPLGILFKDSTLR